MSEAAAPSSTLAEPRPGRVSSLKRFPVLAYIVRRMLASVATLFVASALIFASIQVLPGNVIEVVLGRNATPERVAKIGAMLRLNDSLGTRYFSFLAHFLRGDFGESTAALVQGGHVSIAEVIWPAISNSLILSGIVLVIFIPLAGLIGILSGLSPNKPIDHVLSNATLAISALPEFLIGAVLIFVFFLKLGWLPPISSVPDDASPLDDPIALVLPTLTLLLISLAFGARQLRASVIEVMAKEYITVARVNGITEQRILTRYLVPNALVPSVQILAQQIQYLIGGIVVVESVFNYPGIGQELVRAIATRDVQATMVTATILSIAYVTINVVADVVCAMLDPRVRTSL